MNEPQKNTPAIALVGMAGRFPKAANLDQFWGNLCRGVEAISFFSDEELEAARLSVPKGNPSYVKARGILEDADLFDAAFFGVNPREAEVMDPQHRVFLECAWEALESAGYDPERYQGAIGVFAGMSMNTYLAANLASHPELIGLVGQYQVMLGNDKDFLPTRVSYKLNLTGPSLNIQTACSTSLVAVCVACQSLLNYQCDMALAGAVSISFPQKAGYWHREGGIASPDGHCRVFDAKAAGTVPGEGVGIVLLKRLEDALADGDQVYAVIKGFALNNDGAMKIGYTAPSVDGQAEAIALAQALAQIEPETISYLEAHGTGTSLGDPIEIAALTKAFRDGARANGFCAVGSVKSNIGHLDAAAGVAGLIKTALALHHKRLPPSLHFEAPNPKIDFANSPFYVNTTLREWETGRTPRRAGVSSFGIGGTNAHVVLEEAPAREAPESSRANQLLLWSAKSATALDLGTANLAAHLKAHPELNLADAAYTLQVGRRHFAHRRMLVCRDVNDAVTALESRDARRIISRVREPEQPHVAFLFPGQGAQEVNMALDLYHGERTFRNQVDLGCGLLETPLGFDLRKVLYPGEDKKEEAKQQLTQTCITQPALFVIEYALAKLWMSWGVLPESMIGHSIGEYVAACLAGVFTLEEALRLVAARGWLMQQLPGGAMLAVRLPEKEVQPLLNGDLALAAVNAPSLCVVSGTNSAVETLQTQLAERRVASRPVETSHAFHSPMMAPILKSFMDVVREVKLKAPQVPFLSNVTGTWMTPEQATDPAYWAKHLRQTVRFADGIGELFQAPGRILLEVGPRQTLSTFARQHSAKNAQSLVLSSLPQTPRDSGELSVLLNALGQLWLAGVPVDWPGFYAHEQRRRARLPTYPFERKRFWIEPATTGLPQPAVAAAVEPSERQEVQPDTASADRSQPAPGSAPRQQQIAATLRALLGDLAGLNLAEMNGHTTFAEMGFDSLFLTQASLAIEKKLGVCVAFWQLLEDFSTLDALAAHIDRTLSPQARRALPHEPASEPAPPPASPAGASRPRQEMADAPTIPLTEGQKEIWFASQMSDAASCAFNESRLLRVRGPLRLESVRAALQCLVDRHEALRTSFSPTGDSQRIQRTLKLDVPLVDLAKLLPDERARKLEAMQLEEARQAFNLVEGPLLRARLVKLDESDHLLLVTVQHIVCDAHSLGVLLRELGEVYAAECRGLDCRLPAPLQLSEYVREEGKRLASAERADAEAYWLREFSGAIAALELPTDRPRPSVWVFDGARECRTLSPALGRDLRRLSAGHGCTLFTTMLAAYYLFLHRLTGQEEIVVGIPTAERTMEGAETLVGHCINFLPLRRRVTGNPSFAEFLREMMRHFLEAYDHRQCAFGSLVQKLNLPRDPSRMPLASVTFNLERLRDELKLGDLNVELTANPHSAINFDLTFNITDTPEHLLLDCRYNTALFSSQTIQRWLGHFQTLLEGIAANPERKLSEFSLLSATERRQVLTDWNNTRAEYPRQKCLHHLFEEQAQRTPDAVAVTFDTEALTYRQLNQQADRVARQLRLLKVGPDVPVGLCLERSAEMIVGVLGILKAGGAYLPLDPAYPKERLALMLDNARVPVLLTQERLVAALPETKAQLLRLGSLDHSAPITADEPMPPPNVTPDNLAYVIHTSGSTGVPKGVAIEHRSAVNFIHWARGVFTCEELAGVLFSTSICFDLSVFELFVPLSSGGQVIVARNALELPNLPAKADVTLINTVPSAAIELVRLHALPPSVGVVNLGGEAVKPAVVDQLYASGTVKKVYDLYGPTETTTYSTFARRRAGAPATIGRPIANTQVYLLDANRQPVPIGVIGEIYIGGDGLARGYLKRPDLTADRFIPNPFSREPGARLYQTGDLARWMPDGNIEFLGRADHQVKVRGFCIELGEIEAVLAQHPAVRQCAAIAREDSPGAKRLVAYVVQDADKAATTISDLRRFLAEKLPEYMVPSVVVLLDALPLTATGKVNRRALPAPDPARTEPAETFAAPGTPTEQALVEVWREVLGLKQVGVRDNFFALGGHSLLMTQVISRVREAFQVEVPIRSFFESLTVAALARVIEEMLVEEIKQMSDDEARGLVPRRGSKPIGAT